jgi:hypothetical protein
MADVTPVRRDDLTQFQTDFLVRHSSGIRGFLQSFGAEQSTEYLDARVPRHRANPISRGPVREMRSRDTAADQSH